MKLNLVIIVGIFLISCSKTERILDKQKILRRETVALHFHDRVDTSFFQYLGCGGLYIKNKSTAILIDPFFSNPGLLRSALSTFRLGKIRSHKKDIDFGVGRIFDTIGIKDLKGVKAVFVAHGHYDHLMDVPYVYRAYLDPQTKIYCNRSSINTVRNVVPQGNLVSIEEDYSLINYTGTVYYFHNNHKDSVRVIPILSDHNPHFKGLKLYNGNTCDSCIDYADPLAKTNVNDWKEGKTFSFLIDFVKNGQITLRIFVQSSSCNGPAGFPPEELLQQKNVDLAFLGVASYHFSCDYPWEYINYMKPTYISFIHWENFFRGYQKSPKKVTGTNVKAFFNERINALPRNIYTMPVPGVQYKVIY